MSSRVSYEDAFNTPEYSRFKDAIAKTSLDNKVIVKDNNIVFGKNKVSIPHFVNYLQHLEELQQERSVLLKAYSDVYDKIITADRPEKHKQSFNELVSKINSIEVLIDELQTFIHTKNQISLKNTLQQEILTTNAKIDNLINGSRDNLVVDTGLLNEIVSLHKTNINLHASLNDAKHILPHDYVIVEKKHNLAGKPLKHTTLTKRQKIKSTVKKLMIDKL
jgi:hypothetical protein